MNRDTLSNYIAIPKQFRYAFSIPFLVESELFIILEMMKQKRCFKESHATKNFGKILI